MRTPRLTLMNQIFWRVLPATYDKINQHWISIAELCVEARLDLLSSDRAGAVASLRAEVHMLEKDIEEYRGVAKEINITNLAGMYVVAGRARRRALQIARADFENMDSGLCVMEDKVREIKAELASGFEPQVR